MKKLLMIILIICLFLLSGCNQEPQQEPVRNNGGTQAISPSEDASISPEKENGDVELPIDETPPTDNKSSEVIEIKEKMFIAQTNDIYLNGEDYLGKTIKYEGIFDLFTWEETGETYYYVIRYGPGCCGTDGDAGFEVTWDGEYPNQNDWVEAVGILETYEESGHQYLRLRLSSLKVLPTRGAEYVSH
ncbi:hypothetical protein NSA47_14395 [Irregularibacter muris]|uniref:DUF1980 domain-containing protein n=1 Tax=Irregularibacter muris TaxID=1796619 RepID=A0AAE3HJS7_9FIRM|nr:hypothetical protein [Irregularibacter muris]MCR1900154.1 hypothetical protein [Irregularibacter muris]